MMIAADMPPPAQEQVLRDGLAKCGLKASGITMAFDGDVQGFVITIAVAAGATVEHLQCIETVTRGEEVFFEVDGLGSAFIERRYAQAKTLWLVEAKETLGKRGLLDGLPKRADFTSDEQFAVAMERHCGFAAGSILKVRNGEIVFWPESIGAGEEDYERLSALIAAVSFATADSNDFKMGFVGNENFADRP